MSGNRKQGRTLVVGGGISGITAAIEVSEAGCDAVLVEKNPYLGCRVAQMNQYFPKLCPPSCGLEINYKRLKTNERVTVYTQTEVADVDGEEGAFEVQLKVSPRFVDAKCTACGDCAAACELEVDNPFDYGMSRMKAAYLPHQHAYPMRYALHPDLVASDEAQKVKDACKLPVRSRPGGQYNRNALRAAAAALAGARGGLKGVSAQDRRKAARRVVRLMREAGINAGPSILRIAGMR